MEKDFGLLELERLIQEVELLSKEEYDSLYEEACKRKEENKKKGSPNFKIIID